MTEKVQRFICRNPACKPLRFGGDSRVAAGPGVVKEFRHWSPVGAQLTPGCISCNKPMERYNG